MSLSCRRASVAIALGGVFTASTCVVKAANQQLLSATPPSRRSHLDTHSLIWRPSRVADTPPLLPISRYGH